MLAVADWAQRLRFATGAPMVTRRLTIDKPAPGDVSGVVTFSGAWDMTGLSAGLYDLAVVATGAIPAAVKLSISQRLLHATDLVYQGSFRVPAGAVGTSTFDYGGTALAFNPARGSLFMVGYALKANGTEIDVGKPKIVEITIPAVRQSTTLAALDVALVLQPFSDVAEGHLRDVETDQSAPVNVGGLLPYLGKLYASADVNYDGSGLQIKSHFSANPDAAVTGEVRGPYQVGTLGAGLVSGYFGLIPAAWQQALGGPVLNGQCCLNIISRTSFGPCAFVIDPAKIGVLDPVPAAPLVYYTQDHQLGSGYGTQSTLFNGSTQMGGVVFPEGTRTVLFFGSQGLGPECYGIGTADKALVGTVSPEGEPYCYDPLHSAKGSHAYPYAAYVWAYDANDFVAVRKGILKPWAVVPYAVWSMPLPFDWGCRFLGATYDPATGRFFVTTAGDDSRPVVHVLTVKPCPMR